jgi:hypothetical protein
MSFRTARMSIIAIFLALSAANARATIIDLFNDTNSDLYRVSSSRTADSGHWGTIAAIGGFRDYKMNWVDLSSSYLEVLPDSPAGLTFTQNGQAKTTVTWQGATSYALDEDFSADNAFDLYIASVTELGMSVKMTVYSADGTLASSTTSIDVPKGFSGVRSFKFADFNQAVAGVSGAATFADIDAIVLELNGTGRTGSDIVISSLKTVPEPSCFALLAIGVVAFFGLRRRFPRA